MINSINDKPCVEDNILERLELLSQSLDENETKYLSSDVLQPIIDEYIRLKAIEQAALDFIKSDKVIENIEDLSYSNLKELLQID